MNRLSALAVLLFAFALPAAAFGQNAPSAQTAPSNQYNDPAMSFTAPADFRPIPVPSHDPANFENPTVMAAYAKAPGTQQALSIVVRMQNFDGNADQWATNADNQLRGSVDGAFIKRNSDRLSNGMPAYWEEITVGSGFNQIKMYRYLWSDGVRGIELALTSRNGAIDGRHAKEALSNVSAVAYPRYRP